MKYMSHNDIRNTWFRFFENKGHKLFESAPLVPINDDSLLWVNAGVTPLKKYFDGSEIPESRRLMSIQKCIRTNDIENVGVTKRHQTFFEMMGNFSVGDYFKNEAIAFAFELLTSPEYFDIDKDLIYVTVYSKDLEARDRWIDVGLNPKHIIPLDGNFWEIGTGPCGPCSEIYFDRGEKYGCGSPDCKVGCECDRFVEFWNLVFTQFDKDENGNYNRLANPNIDTGMGLERLAVIMQDVGNIFEVDTIRNIMLKVSEIAGVTYKKDEKTDVSLRVITDHIRSTVFLVSDGVIPSNEGRGYVLRRLLRRAARHGKLLGIKEKFLYNLADTVIEESKGAYPVLEEKADYIKTVIKQEEERFDKTIDAGLEILESIIKNTKNTISGQDAFKLYDTFGFPIDLTIEIAEENGLNVDISAFETEMQNQRKRARDARNVGEDAGWAKDIFSEIKGVKTDFIGYKNDTCDAKIVIIAKDGELVDSADENDDVIIVTDKTVFYGESGGQVGDKGEITSAGLKIEINDTKKAADGKFLHYGKIISGCINKGDSVSMKIDTLRRKDIEKNHSTTHLLQKALREVLGTHVEQSGSYVSDTRLRFDFTHFSAMTKEELNEVEKKVNDAILAQYPIEIFETDIKSAKELGATALFGEKYGEKVRVVKMGDYSIELCGGCHLNNTGFAGMVKILSESGVAAGVRRIEAVTGRGVINYLAEKDAETEKTAEILKTSVTDIAAKAESIVAELKSAEREISSLKSKMAGGIADELLSCAEVVNGVKVITAKLEEMDVDALRKLGDSLKEKESNLFTLLAGINGDKITFVAMATAEAVKNGVHAGKIIKEVATFAGGGGGGKPDAAQAGGKDISKVDGALALVKSLI